MRKVLNVTRKSGNSFVRENYIKIKKLQKASVGIVDSAHFENETLTAWVNESAVVLCTSCHLQPQRLY